MKKHIFLILILLSGIKPLIAQQIFTVNPDPLTCNNSHIITNVIGDYNFTVFPNPNDGKFYLTATNIDFSSLNISIFNAFGQVIYSAKGKAAEGDKNMFDISFISDGVYFIRIEGMNTIIQKRFIKL